MIDMFDKIYEQPYLYGYDRFSFSAYCRIEAALFFPVYRRMMENGVYTAVKKEISGR